MIGRLGDTPAHTYKKWGGHVMGVTNSVRALLSNTGAEL